MRLLRILFVVLFFATGMARGQSTRPAGDATSSAVWEKEVSAFAAAVAAHDVDSLEAHILAHCVVHKFGGDRDADLTTFTNFVALTAVLGDHAYVYPYTGLAQDIAQDVNSSPLVSDDVKKSLALTDDGAQAVAVKWVTLALGATQEERVGVIVLWSVAGGTDDSPRPLFILVKGLPSTDGFRLTRVVYGDPLQQQ